MIDHLFYRRTEPSLRLSPAPTLDNRYAWFLWKPSLFHAVPKGVRRWPYMFWWLLHYLHVYRCRDYGILVIYDGNQLIHRSCIFPKWLRFPFMADGDLQVADTWTHDNYRGKGLAVFAVACILNLHERPGRVFWYQVRINNRASIRVAEKSGFHLYGKGSRVSRFHSRILGCFQIDEYV